MPAKTKDGRAPRRLARHLVPVLLAGGLLLVAAVAIVATTTSRAAAVEQLNARADGYRALAEASLRHSGRLGTTAVAARREGVQLALVPNDRPLPDGRSVESHGGTRVYTFAVTARHGADRRLRIALADAPIARATKRALVLSIGLGVALLLLLAGALWARLRRLALTPLARLRAVVERLAVGQRVEPTPARGAREVREVADLIAGVSSTLAELEAQATTDPLTGVANRRSFQRSLDTEMKRATRESKPMTLVLLDLDGFKAINDAHGHPFGDGVLQVIADKISKTLRATDVIARVGGDEFAMILAGMPRQRAADLVERAREEATRSIGGVAITWSAGIATYPTDARDGETLMECADAALYCAKNTGESAICHYDPEIAQSPHPAGDRGLVEELLAKRDAVVPVFQPLVSLSTGRIAGFEALARFPHPPARRPDEWFAIASRCGLGPELEARAVQAALASAGRPRGTYLSFNLSASALMSETVMKVLPADLSDLVIEITENERVADDEKLAAQLEPLRRRGARIAVDDAGAGYSGLQQVMRIHPDLIKLDRSLVANVDSDPAKAALIDSFVRFAQRTGAAVCAEGIETPEELKVLADLDVTYGQGFGLARPAAPWAPVAPWVAGTIRPRTLRAEPEADAQENDDLRLARLSSRLANVRSAQELAELAGEVAEELGADDVCVLRPVDGDSVEALTDHGWLPAGSRFGLTHYATLRQMLRNQEVLQVLANDASADIGDLSLLGRGGHASMLLAPVVSQGEVTGVMIAFSERERPWTRAETSRARIVGLQLAGAVEAAAEAGARVVALPQPASAADSSRFELS